MTGHEHNHEEPYISLRLPDALLKNFNEDDWLPGKDTHYVITYDPATNQAQVQFDAKTTLLDLNKDAAEIPNMESSAQRTFWIHESNELEESANPYVIDKNAPFTLSVSTIKYLP